MPEQHLQKRETIKTQTTDINLNKIRDISPIKQRNLKPLPKLAKSNYNPKTQRQAGKSGTKVPMYKSLEQMMAYIMKAGSNLYKIAPGNVLKIKYRNNTRPNNRRIPLVYNAKLMGFKNNNKYSEKVKYISPNNQTIYDPTKDLIDTNPGIYIIIINTLTIIFFILGAIGKAWSMTTSDEPIFLNKITNTKFNVII